MVSTDKKKIGNNIFCTYIKWEKRKGLYSVKVANAKTVNTL